MTDKNLYEAPEASLAGMAIWIPEDILRKIKGGWIAALFSAAMTLAAPLVGAPGIDMSASSGWALLDVGLILALAFGIYNKSRACAVIMLVYFITARIILVIQTGQPTGLVLGLLFAIFYWQAVVGTFAFHKFMKEAPR